MKPEPLKDKVYAGNKILKRVYHEQDILSAVEWLKEYLNEPVYYFKKFPEQLKDFWKRLGLDESVMIPEETKIWKNSFNNWLIDKAFQDVVIKK